MAQRSGLACGGRLTSYASTIVDAPPDVVWTAVTDIDANPSNISTVRAVERIDGSSKGDEVKAGTRWKETRVCGRGGEHTTAVVQTKTVSFVGSHGSHCCSSRCNNSEGEEEGGPSGSKGKCDGDDENDEGGEQFFYTGGSAPQTCPRHPSWPRSFSLSISYDAPYDGFINTSTLTVQPYHEGDDTDPDSPKKEQRTLLCGTFAAVPARLRDKISFSLTWCFTRKQTTKAFQGEIDELAAAARRAIAAVENVPPSSVNADASDVA